MTHTHHRRLLRQAAVLSAGLVAGFGWFGPASAAGTTVKGTVNLPAELRTGRVFFGHWRVENTNVAIQHANPRGGTVVFLVGPPIQAVPPKNVSVEISDKVSHDLSTPSLPQIMPPERLSAGTVRKQRFSAPGEYLVRCTEYPHIVVSVIVTNSPLFSVTDEKGAFKINDVPEGHATLKVWSGGRWVKEAEVDVPARGLDLTVKVPSASGAVEPAEPTAEPAKENAE